MNKRPALQFYPGDWWRANDIKGCSMSTQGVWFNLLMAMWDAPEQGKIRGSKEALCRVVGADEKEFTLFLSENKVRNFANVTIRNNIVTVKNRRMYKEYIARIGTKERVRRHRQQAQQEGNREVTPPSSTSSSTSTTNKEYMSIFDEVRKYYPGDKRGLETEFTYFCKTHKDWKNVASLLLPAIKAEEDRRFNLERANKFVPSWKHFKTWVYNRCWEVTTGHTVTAEEKTTSDQQALKKKRQEIYNEYGQYYKERSILELRTLLKNKNLINHWWLIKEIIAKRKGK